MLTSLLLLTGFAPLAEAQTLQVNAIYMAVPAGAPKSDSVTFDLPRAVRIGGQWYIMPTLALWHRH